MEMVYILFVLATIIVVGHDDHLGVCHLGIDPDLVASLGVDFDYGIVDGIDPGYALGAEGCDHDRCDGRDRKIEIVGPCFCGIYQKPYYRTHRPHMKGRHLSLGTDASVQDHPHHQIHLVGGA